MTIYQIIQELATTSSVNEKKAILERNKHNVVLKQVFYFAYNPRYNYWIKADTDALVGNNHSGSDINLATLDSLYALINRKVTGHDARLYFQTLLQPLSSQAREILCRIVNHDLRCGTSDTLASKTWPKLVPEYPMMLCGKYDSKSEKYLKKFENKEGYIVQRKSDGGRINIIVDDSGNVTYRSRSGNELNLFHFFDADFSRFPNRVFDGELLIRTETGKPDRKMSNGFYTKAVRDTLTKEEASKFYIDLWDIISADEFATGLGKTSYEDRLTSLMNMSFSPRVQIVESEKCQTLETCFKFYERMRQAGEEGAIIKVASSVWEDKRSKNAIKLKAVETADLLCIGVEEGQGKYKGLIGNLICTTKCRKLITNPGSGLTDADRAKNPSEFIGKILEIQYNEVIQAKSKDAKPNLFLPIFKQVRFDKTEANTLEELK